LCRTGSGSTTQEVIALRLLVPIPTLSMSLSKRLETLGDTWADARLIGLGDNFSISAGEVKGYVDTGGASITREFNVQAYEYCDLASNENHNRADLITDIHSTGYADIWKGSWLVRNYSSTPVSEPVPALLLAPSLLGLLCLRKRRADRVTPTAQITSCGIPQSLDPDKREAASVLMPPN
jgi:hypothetical protein